MKLQLITGSARDARAIEPVLSWVTSVAKEHPDVAHVDVTDLRDWPLPLFNEGPGAFRVPDAEYTDPIVARWNDHISDADAYLFVTPEYNHSVPAVLKNAIDSVYGSFAFRNKPTGFVGYSAGVSAGVRAIEHLALIAIEMELVPLRSTVLMPYVGRAFGPDGVPLEAGPVAALSVLLEDLVWWSRILTPAREAGQLPPGVMRFVQRVQAPR